MQIVYDHDLKIAGIGVAPWRRLGPEKWFPQYAIASLYGADGAKGGPRVVSLEGRVTSYLPKKNTASLLANKEFVELVDRELPGYDLMLYRATSGPLQLGGHKILMPDQKLARAYENKAEFRRRFSSKIPFAPFRIITKEALRLDREKYDELVADAPQGIVIQDARLSGGRGTYVVRDFEGYMQAVESLIRNGGDKMVVISRLIPDPQELSIQVCVTRYGVFTGPLQHQIIRDPALVPNTPGANAFCGIQIVAADQNTELHKQIASIAQEIGSDMQGAGYKGVFGVDLLRATDGTIYVLEVNPRITGATPLLNSLYGPEEGVPFNLLHILELGGYEYSILDNSAEPSRQGSLMMLYSLDNEPKTVTKLPVAGTYRLVCGEVEHVSDNMSLQGIQHDEFILLPQVQVGSVIQPSGMLLSIHSREQVIDLKDNTLYNNTISTIAAVRKKVELK